jgi:hypothetical protein
MSKKFNITGKCHPNRHYMADTSQKLAQTFTMVENGDYFIINRPRQYGKTTMLYAIADWLSQSDNFLVFNISFEGIGDSVFEEEERFCTRFIELLATYAEIYDKLLHHSLLQIAHDATDMNRLSNIISKILNQTKKKVVLIIDEVDKSSNNQLFISFLAMLRNKYLAQDDYKTFHSVVLAGVHDVKSLKLKLRPDVAQKYNSPWNIAADYNVDLNFSPSGDKTDARRICTNKKRHNGYDIHSNTAFLLHVGLSIFGE